MDKNDYKVINMIVSKYLQYGQLLKILDFLCPWTKEKKSKGFSMAITLSVLFYIQGSVSPDN